MKGFFIKDLINNNDDSSSSLENESESCSPKPLTFNFFTSCYLRHYPLTPVSTRDHESPSPSSPHVGPIFQFPSASPHPNPNPTAGHSLASWFRKRLSRNSESTPLTPPPSASDKQHRRHPASPLTPSTPNIFQRFQFPSVNPASVLSQSILRRRYSKAQTDALVRKYNENKYLSRTDMALLSSETGLSMVQVKIWFQNRRLKDRKRERDIVASVDNNNNSMNAQDFDLDVVGSSSDFHYQSS